MLNNILLLLASALPLMGSPGPATLSVAAVGTAYGSKNGRRYLAGIILGTISVVLIVASGVTGLLLSEPKLALVISICAAAYILYLAFKIATAPVLSGASDIKLAPSFAAGYILAISNPKAFAAIGAVYSGHSLVTNDWLLDGIAKITVLSIVVICVNTAWLLFGSALSTVLQDPKKGRLANILFAVMLVASVGVALL